MKQHTLNEHCVVLMNTVCGNNEAHTVNEHCVVLMNTVCGNNEAHAVNKHFGRSDNEARNCQ